MANTSSTPDWSLAEGHGYVMNRSHVEACRLNLQHYLWKEALQFTIHPSIPITNSSIIADIASGTCSWLIDVSHQLPTAQLHGFDSDLDKAPHRHWLPSNITLHHWNIFDDIPNPEDSIGKYDFIDVRLLVLVIEQGNPRPLLEKLLKMLKPGGYLQWDELDCVNMHVKTVDPSVKAQALEQLRKMSWANGRYDWTIDMPKFMAEEGFQDVTLEHFGDKIELVRSFNEQHLLTMEEFGLSLMRMGKKEAAEAFFKVIREAYHESTLGSALCIPRIVCVGRKAS